MIHIHVYPLSRSFSDPSWTRFFTENLNSESPLGEIRATRIGKTRTSSVSVVLRPLFPTDLRIGLRTRSRAIRTQIASLTPRLDQIAEGFDFHPARNFSPKNKIGRARFHGNPIKGRQHGFCEDSVEEEARPEWRTTQRRQSRLRQWNLLLW